MEQTKTVNFSVIKQKIIKTDEVLRMYLQANDKLKKVQQAYKEIKLKYDQETVNSSRLQIESERYNFNFESIKLRNNQLEKENEVLREQKLLLEEKYNQQTIQSQLNIRGLEDELKFLQEIKTEASPIKKKRNSTIDDYEKRIRGFEEKIKELNDMEASKKSKIEQLNSENKQLSNDIVIAKEEFSKSIQKLQNENNTLVDELNRLKLKIKASKFHNNNKLNSQLTMTSIEDKDQDIKTESESRLEEENNRPKQELICKENANNVKKDLGENTYVQSDSVSKNHTRTIHIQTTETMKTVELKDLMQAENKKLKQTVLECNAEIIKLKAKSAKAKTKCSATQTEHVELKDESVDEILKEMCMPLPVMLSPMSATSYENLNVDNTQPPILGEVAELDSVFKDIPDIIITPSTPVIEKNIENFTDFIKYEEMQMLLNNESVDTIEQVNMPTVCKNLIYPLQESQEIEQFSLPSIASTPVIEENITDFSKSDCTNDTEQIEQEHENKICKYSSQELQETVRVSHTNKSELKNSLERQNRDINTEALVKPIRRKKYLAPSIVNNFVMLKRSYLKRLLNKKYILGKELRKLRKVRKQDCILKALHTLKDSKINFTISNESILRNSWNDYDYAGMDFCPRIIKAPLTSNQSVIYKHKTTKCFTEKLSCNLKCCSDSNCYMLLNNKAEPELLGFYSVKKEIITPLSSSMEVLDKCKSSNQNKLLDSTVNTKKGLTTENLLDTLADLVSQKLKEKDHSVPKRKRRKHDSDHSNSLCSETESEIERLFEKSNSDVLKKSKMLLQRAKKEKERALSSASLYENNNSLIKHTILDKKDTAEYQDVPSTSIDISGNSHPTYLHNISPSNSIKMNSLSANSIEVGLERYTESPTKLMTPSNICSDPQLDVLSNCPFIPCNENTNDFDFSNFPACPQLLSPIRSISSKCSPKKDSGKLVNFEADQLKENEKVVSSEMAADNDIINLKNLVENNGLLIRKDMSSVVSFSNNTDINTENILSHALPNNDSSLDINIDNLEPVLAKEDVFKKAIQQKFLSIKQNLLLENNFEKKNSMIQTNQHLNSFYAGDTVDKDDETSLLNTSKPVIQSMEEKLNIQECMQTAELKNIESIPSCPESPIQEFKEVNFRPPIIIPLEKGDTELSTYSELAGISCTEFFKPAISFDCEKDQNVTEVENLSKHINSCKETHSMNPKTKSRPASPKILRRSLRNIKKLSSQISQKNDIKDSNININDRLIDPAEMEDDTGTVNVKSENINKSINGRSKSIKVERIKRKIGRPKKRKSSETKHDEEADNLSHNAINSSKEVFALNMTPSLKSELEISQVNLSSSQESKLKTETKTSTKEKICTEEEAYSAITKNSLSHIVQTSSVNLVETSKLLGPSLPTELNAEKSIRINAKTIEGMAKSTITKKRKTMSKLKSNVLREVSIRRKMFQNNQITYGVDKNSTCALECNNSDRISMDLEATNVNIGVNSMSLVDKQNNVSEDIKLNYSANRCYNEKIHIVQNILIPANSNRALDLLHQRELSEGEFAANCDIRFGIKQNSSQNTVDTRRLSIEKTKINKNSDNTCKAPVRMKPNRNKSIIPDNNSTDILSKIMEQMDKDKPKQLLEPKNKPVNLHENVPATIGDREWRSGFISIAEKIYNASSKEESATERVNNNQKLLTDPNAKPSKKTAILMSKLLKSSSEESIPDEIILEFKRYQVDNIAELILQNVSKDVNDKPDGKYYPAPLMTKTQRILLRLMIQLEKDNVKTLMDKFLSKAETFLFKIGCGIRTVVPVTRLYMAVCKLRADITRMRMFCWNAFQFICDLAIPLLFTVLTSWTEVLPKEPDLQNYPLTKVLVQIVHLKGCNRPGYNLLPLRALLNQFYGYPKERWNCDEIFEECFHHYLRNPVKSSDLALRLLCKNKDTNWVYKKINEFFKPLIYKIPSENVNFKATAILLIGNICRQFKPQNEFDKTCLVELRRWLIGLIEDGGVSDLVKQSVYLCLTRLPKNRVAKKVKKKAKKQTTSKKISIQKNKLRKKKKKVMK